MRGIIAVLCGVLLLPGDYSLWAARLQEAAAPEAAPKIPPDQLDSLVAPIALYPDPLLSQTLVASTYPLEIIQLQQWLDKNKGLKDQALADAVKKQNWDPSIQALAPMPDVVKRLSENITWTTDLGNAFLAQQSDVMDAVQRMRKKAESTGNLKSSEQQKVETKVVESKQVIVIEQANPQVVYVPSYNPTVVYGPPVYAYPPVTYPPPGYYAAGMAISFGIGVAMGAAWGGGWGWGCGWGGNNDITINNNNSFVNNSNRQNIQGGNRASTRPSGGQGTWKHNPQHRGGAPYGDRATARQYGGNARGDSLSSRQDNARRQQGQQRDRQQGGVSDRSRQGGAGDRGAGDRGAGDRGTGDRGAGGNRPSAGTSDRGAGGRDAGNRPSAGTSDRGGGDRVGNRSVSSGGGGRDSSAFSGGGGRSSGSSARASSSRGSSSMGGSRGGGRSGGGGGRRR
jgi:hypothetical protein